MKTTKHGVVLGLLAIGLWTHQTFAQSQASEDEANQIMVSTPDDPGNELPKGPLDTKEPTSLEDHNILIFPNPGNGMIQIKNNFPGNQEIAVYNLTGKIERKLNISGSNPYLDLTSLKNGIYLLKTEQGTFKYNKI